jgi:hypothetical protein
MNLTYYQTKLEKDPNLFDLLAIRGYDRYDRQLLLKHINSGEISLGSVWENALTEFMTFTKKCGVNCKSMDWEDGTDGKFVMTTINDDPNDFYISLGGIKNKTGTLRVCICSRQDNYKLYFMLIPHKVYSKWNQTSPLKLRFTKDGFPTGYKWQEYYRFLVPFSYVSAPMSNIIFKID